MIPEAGLAALWLAAALSLLQTFVGWGAVRKGNENLIPMVRPVAVAQGAMAALSFALLIYVFLQTDLSVKLVVDNSHSHKPWLYKFAGAWGNHEGSMLLWVTVLGVAGAFVAMFERRLRKDTSIATLAAQATISLGFYAFLLFASNPFTRTPLDPITQRLPLEGNGLNPLLQDPGLAFHPPTLYFGYVGVSVAFSFAVGALITRDVGPSFARAMRPWILAAWIFLTIGITAGSYWAYYELGWGGWWFWDPVENASLMPWLAATALLHSVTVLATRDGLRAWTVMLAVVAFSMSMVGTFLVRSGILTSVHSFAVDPRRGAFILGLLVIYIGGALVLFGARVGTVKEGSTFEPVSREGALVINNLLLSMILGLVLIGTLYPLIVEAFVGDRSAVPSIGAPWFNATTGPVALILVALMGIGPLMRWRRDNVQPVLRRVAIPVLVSAVSLLAVILFAPHLTILQTLGLSIAPGVLVASFAPLWGRNLRRTPMFTYGMVIAHAGIAVSMIGMAAETGFTTETLTALRPGQSATVGNFNVRFEGVEPVVGPNWTAVGARLMVKQGEGEEVLMQPEARMFSAPPTPTTEAAITTYWNGQLYLVLGERNPDGTWQLRLWWKPFVTLIWFGGILVALGGLLSIVGRVLRERKSAKAADARESDEREEAATEPAPEQPTGKPGREALA